MELYQLEYFKEIASTQNLQVASRNLHVSQPSLSRCIKALEDEFQTPLFDRIGRAIVLNDAGKIFLDGIDDILDQVHITQNKVQSYARYKQESINFSTEAPLGGDGSLIFDFMKRYPTIKLRVSSTMFLKSINEKPDLTFSVSREKRTESNYCLIGEELFVLAVPKSSALANEPAIKLADLEGVNFILPVQGIARNVIDEMFEEANIHPKDYLENEFYSQVASGVLSGYGYAIVPSVTNDLADDRLIYVPFSDVIQKRYLYVHWPEGHEPTSAVRCLIDYLTDYYRYTFQESRYVSELYQND